MKDKWYADNRDLVKWGSIVSIAREKSIRTIIQVALYRPGKNTLNISIDDGKKTYPAEFPTEVWDHFRNIEDIQRLEEKTNLKIIVHKEPFQFRLQYFEDLCSKIKEIAESKIIFLDPDIGIAPNNGAKFEHVKPSEIKQVYNSLNPNDILVFYQHAWHVADWKKKAKNKFKQAISTTNEIKTYYSENIVNDVVLFVVKRT